jgi:chromosome partitioning protein
LIVSIINHKGGVGKSCITTNLAHALADRGKKVLVIDCDPQCNTSSIFYPAVDVADPKTLYDLYANSAQVAECIYGTTYENIDIIMNSADISHLEIELYQDVKTSYQILRNNLREYVDENYDITIIDNNPSLGLYTINSLIASDCAIVPIEAGCRYSLDGFVAALDAISSIAARVNPELRFLKAIINKADSRTSISRVSIDHIQRKFADKVFSTIIHSDTKIKEAVAFKLTVLRHAPACAASNKFRSLAEEVLGLL